MIQTIYYLGLFALSIILTFLYVIYWHKQLDDHLTSIFILIPIANLAYLLMYTGHLVETNVALLKIAYIGGCFLPWLVAMCVMNLCQISVSRPARILTLLASVVVYLSVLTIGYYPLFYKSLSFKKVGDYWVPQKVYGPFHTLHYVLIVLYLVADVAAIIYSYKKNKQVSRRILALLFLPIPIVALGYFAGHWFLRPGAESMPLTYTMTQVVYLLIAQRMVLYNVSELVIESQIKTGDTGFITIDNKGRYLGSNDTAKKYLPQLMKLRADQLVESVEDLNETVTAWLNLFMNGEAVAANQDSRQVVARKDDGSRFLLSSGSGIREEIGDSQVIYQDPDLVKLLYTCRQDGIGAEYNKEEYKKENNNDELIYLVTVSHLYDGRKRCGYQIFMQDDTGNQQYIRLLDRYNSDLQEEVAAKTDRIVVMHDKLIMGMASMVESRDNSTGGHIKRTSKGVAILIDAMREDESLHLSDTFCRDIIKAAPMHDLGKIAVDDAVLRKPGRFTPEEFEKMKAHPAEGARMIRIILEDTDDEEFRQIAENVAHYHHERMDGSGYPDGLKGEEIPLEARIMAIADVYDALVSKRVYKEEYSFDKADQIILEGMGSQFDPNLKKYYLQAKPRLEEYYSAC